MKRLIVPLRTSVLALSLALGAPALAQEAEEDGMSLMEEGARLFFRGLMGEMEPALNDLQELAEGMEPALEDFITQMGPALRDLMREIEDWSAYHPPEVLPNGDIILRRKADAPEPEPGGEIEL